MKGKVWLVGAGPSDIGLLTLKAKEVIEKADVVVYDALVGSGIMALIPLTAEKINVGKRANHHIKRQEETNRILLDKALEGKNVVRLKGGDPFLFGRGGEELELLVANDIPYEIVPGVTSAISVPAYNGIPVTHRDFCSSVHIITGHKKKDAPLGIDFASLAKVGGTCVFLMGVTALPEICEGLINGGMAETTPAAILQKGTTAEQRAVVADLKTLPGRALEEKIETPAIIVVGGVCSLREKFIWHEKLPLFGCRVVVTRPRDRATTLSSRLRELGAQVIELPAIRTVAINETPELDRAIGEIKSYNWIVFTSPAGVTVFMDKIRGRHMDVRALAGLRIAVIGTGTGRELEKYGLFADVMPETYDGENLGRMLAGLVKPGDKVLIPRARLGNAEIISEIKKAGNVEISDIPIYDTVYEKQDAEREKAEFTDHPGTLAVFTSASTVKGFHASTEGLDYGTVKAVCIGKQTAAEAEKLGMQVYVAEKATIDALIDAVIKVHGIK